MSTKFQNYNEFKQKIIELVGKENIGEIGIGIYQDIRYMEDSWYEDNHSKNQLEYYDLEDCIEETEFDFDYYGFPINNAKFQVVDLCFDDNYKLDTLKSQADAYFVFVRTPMDYEVNEELYEIMGEYIDECQIGGCSGYNIFYYKVR